MIFFSFYILGFIKNDHDIAVLLLLMTNLSAELLVWVIQSLINTDEIRICSLDMNMCAGEREENVTSVFTFLWIEPKRDSCG